MDAIVLQNLDTSHIDKLFGEKFSALPASEVAKIPHNERIIWTQKSGIYTFPTTELINWLREQIDGRSAIEICAGRLCLGRHLGIPFSDSHTNVREALAIAVYKSLGVVAPKPPADCEDLDALATVSKYQPKVVIASWATQKCADEREQCSIYGVDESQILAQADYIHIGSTNSHSLKRIINLPHELIRPDWLFTRAIRPELDEIRIWKQQPITYPSLDTKIITGETSIGFDPIRGCAWCQRNLIVTEVRRSLLASGYKLVCRSCLAVKYGPEAAKSVT